MLVCTFADNQNQTRKLEIELCQEGFYDVNMYSNCQLKLRGRKKELQWGCNASKIKFVI